MHQIPHKKISLKKAFTLIEVLVAISIIAVLASLFLPAIQRVKNAAQQLACGNHQRQIALGLLTYGGENSRRMPGAWEEADSGAGDYTRMATTFDGQPRGVGLLVQLGLIQVAEGKALFCPGRRRLDRYSHLARGGSGTPWRTYPANNIESGYFVATTDTWIRNGVPVYKSTWHQLVRTPADKILTLDIVGWDSTPESDYSVVQDYNLRTSHRHGINATRFDGSLTWIPYVSKRFRDYDVVYLAQPWTSGDENFIEYMHTKLLGWTEAKYRSAVQ